MATQSRTPPAMNPRLPLRGCRRAIWLDFLGRRVSADGSLSALVEQDGRTAVTSDPAQAKLLLGGINLGRLAVNIKCRLLRRDRGPDLRQPMTSMQWLRTVRWILPAGEIIEMAVASRASFAGIDLWRRGLEPGHSWLPGGNKGVIDRPEQANPAEESLCAMLNRFGGHVEKAKR